MTLRHAILALLGALLAPSAASASCTTPPGTAGDQFYNTTVNAMQYCNGTVWVNMGSTLGVGTLTSGDICTTDGTNINCTTAVPLSLANGGTNASLTASNGGIFYSTGSAAAILSGTAAANQILMSGTSSAPAWSTATYPATTTQNQILYSSVNNTITGLGTANNSVLATNSSGAPSLSSVLPSAVQGNITTTGVITSGTWNGTTIAIANGGTSNITALGARSSSGLNIDEMTIPATNSGNTNYQILTTDRTVAVGTTALTVARTWTLPLGSQVNAGQVVCIVDKGGGVNSTDTLTIAAAGSDTLQPASTATLKTQYGSVCFTSDSNTPAKWTAVATTSTSGAATPGGSNTDVQFNSSGSLGGDSGFTYGAGTVAIGTALGVGTTAPTTALQVGNAFYVYNLGDYGYLQLPLRYSGSLYLGDQQQVGVPLVYSTTSSLWLGDSSGFGVVVLSGSNVGIGTTAPLNILDVRTTGGPRIAVTSTDSTTGSFAASDVYADASELFMASHSSARTATRYGLTLGGWTEITTFNNTGTSNGMVMGVDTAKPLVFGTNNAERMRIDSSGNVGIGTTSPYGSLNVAQAPVGTSYYGLVSIGTGWNNGTNAFSGSTSGTMIAANAPSGYAGNLMDLQAGGTSELSITNIGAITAGTTYQIIKDVGARFGATAGGEAWSELSSHGLLLDATNSSIAWGNVNSFTQDTTISRLSAGIVEIGTSSTNANGTLLAGSVGIATTAPGYVLEVDNSAAGIPAAALVNTVSQSTTAGGAVGVYQNDGTAMSSGNRLGAFYFGGTDASSQANSSLYKSAGIIAFATQNWTSSAEGSQLQFQVTPNNTVTKSTAMTIDQTGDVSIGTTVPTAPLEIRGTTNAPASTAGILALETAGTTPALRMGVNDGTSTWISSFNSLPLYINYGGNSTILNGSAGSVGIGTTVPQNKLDVQSGALSVNAGTALNTYPSIIELGGNTTNFDVFEASSSSLLTINKGDWANVEIVGNVGIGTTTPATKLAIQPAAFATATDGIEFVATGTAVNTIIQPLLNSTSMNLLLGANFEVVPAGGGSFAQFSAGAESSGIDIRSDNGQIQFFTGTGIPSEVAVINSSGEMGIGNTSPAHTLDVTGTLNVTGAVTCGSGCAAGPWVASGSNIVPTAGDLSFAVGIGTTTPGNYGGVNSKLEIVGTSHTGLAITAPSGDVAVLTFTVAGTPQWFIGSRGTFDTPNNRLSFDTGGSVEAMTILSGGNVGIGTKAPGATLAVNGGVTVGTYAGNDTAAPSNGLIVSGNVGIGYNSPSATLAVNGTASFGVNGIQNGAALSVVGGSSNGGIYASTADSSQIAVYGTTTTSGAFGLLGQNNSDYCYVGTSSAAITCNGPVPWSSDRRLKTDIVPLRRKEGLDALMNIQPVHYHWKGKPLNKDDPYEMGFIAQNVEKVLPDLISEVPQAPNSPVKLPGNKAMGLDYTRMTAPIVLAIQQLKHMFDGDRAAIDQLKADNDNLRAELKAVNDNFQTQSDELRREIAALKKEVHAQ